MFPTKMMSFDACMIELFPFDTAQQCLLDKNLCSLVNVQGMTAKRFYLLLYSIPIRIYSSINLCFLLILFIKTVPTIRPLSYKALSCRLLDVKIWRYLNIPKYGMLFTMISYYYGWYSWCSKCAMTDSSIE